MQALLLEVLIGPALVGAATLVSRRWDDRQAGLVSAFPAIAGPVLLLSAQQHGAAFAARAAQGTLLGLISFSAFVVAYGRVARLARWPISLAAGWVAAGGVALVLGPIHSGLLGVSILAGGSLCCARLALGGAPGTHSLLPAPRWELPVRMGLTAVLVAALTAAASRFGATTGGLLAALPVLACVLAVSTHRNHGKAALTGLLRGMVGGMAGFAAFCGLIALMVARAGVGPAFVVATLAAVAAQATAAIGGGRRRRDAAIAGARDPRCAAGPANPLECR